MLTSLEKSGTIWLLMLMNTTVDGGDFNNEPWGMKQTSNRAIFPVAETIGETEIGEIWRWRMRWDGPSKVSVWGTVEASGLLEVRRKDQRQAMDMIVAMVKLIADGRTSLWETEVEDVKQDPYRGAVSCSRNWEAKVYWRQRWSRCWHHQGFQ